MRYALLYLPTTPNCCLSLAELKASIIGRLNLHRFRLELEDSDTDVTPDADEEAKYATIGCSSGKKKEKVSSLFKGSPILNVCIIKLILERLTCLEGCHQFRLELEGSDTKVKPDVDEEAKDGTTRCSSKKKKRKGQLTLYRTLPTYCLTVLCILVVHCPNPYQELRTSISRSPAGLTFSNDHKALEINGYAVLNEDLRLLTSWIRRLLSSGYAVLGIDFTRFLMKCRHGYAVPSLLDTAY
ncbi:hypothetical protein Tco_0961612 [Tanacetum coccineum]